MFRCRGMIAAVLGTTLLASWASAQFLDAQGNTTYVDTQGNVLTGPNGQTAAGMNIGNLATMAALSRAMGRGRSHSGPVVGPYQMMQMQQMQQQQMMAQQQYINDQINAQKRAEKKEKMKAAVQQQREKEAARIEARKEKALAAAAAASAPPAEPLIPEIAAPAEDKAAAAKDEAVKADAKAEGEKK